MTKKLTKEHLDFYERKNKEFAISAALQYCMTIKDIPDSRGKRIPFDLIGNSELIYKWLTKVD